MGIPFPYLLHWAWVAGALTWIAIGWTAWRLLPASVGTMRAASLMVGALTACVLAALVLVSAVRTPYPIHSESVTLGHLRTRTIAAMRRAPNPILIDSDRSLPSSVLATGLLLDGKRAGIAVRVPAALADRVDTALVLHGSPGSVLVVASDAGVERLSRDPAFRMVARYDRLDPADRRALTDFLGSIDGRVERLVEYQRDHPREYSRMQRLKAQDVHVAVYLRAG